jgi:hypothetical protein
VALREGIEIQAALDYVRRRKPSADPLPQQRDDLLRWWNERDRGDGAGDEALHPGGAER